MTMPAQALTRVPSGTRQGTQDPGVLLVLCQCCRFSPQILAEVAHGKLVILFKRRDERHYVVIGPDLVDRMEGNGLIRCACCDPQTSYGRVLAECRDGMLLIRTTRYQKSHFVALSPERLQLLLAWTPPTA